MLVDRVDKGDDVDKGSPIISGSLINFLTLLTFQLTDQLHRLQRIQISSPLNAFAFGLQIR